MASDRIEYKLSDIELKLEGISDEIRRTTGQLYAMEQNTLGPMRLGVWLLVLLELGKILYGYFSK
jgi:hypothetical protein